MPFDFQAPNSSLWDAFFHLLLPRDLDPNQTPATWLWEILASLPEAEKVAFLTFVSGRSRLPANPADLPQRFTIIRYGTGRG